MPGSRPKTTGQAGSPTSATNHSFGDASAVCFTSAPRVGAFSRWSSGPAKTMGAKLRNSTDMMHLGNPGPGAYNPSRGNLPQAPLYSLSPRRNFMDPSSVGAPGPGAYQPRNPNHLVRGIALGQKIAYGSTYAVGGANPGPAAYNVDLCTSITSPSAVKGGKQKSPAYSFGLRLSHLHRSQTPGPGAYDIVSRPGLAYSMTNRSVARTEQLSPGPGAYNLNYGATRRGRFTSSSHSIHSKLKFLQGSNMNAPGPGQYEAPQQFKSVPLPGS